MSPEYLWFHSPERTNEIAQELLSVFQNWGIDTIALDFDDTLIGSRAIFPPAFNEIAEIFAQATGRHEPKEIRKMIDDTLSSLRHEFSVNPVIVELAVHAVSTMLLGIDPNSEAYERGLSRVHDIYTTNFPLPFEGAVETVDLLKATGIKLVLATHAQNLWTWQKMGSAGFVGKFNDVRCFEVRRTKAEQWQEQFLIARIDPKHALVIGDNYHGDIVPPVHFGARGVWVTNGGREIFSVEKEVHELDPEAQSRVITARSIAHVPEAILRSR